jgi:predicted helicase
MSLQQTLHEVFLRSPPNLFDEFVVECQRWYDQPAHTLTELRTRENKKIRGDIFEEFCVLYLLHVEGFTNVWRLQDVPEEILTKLKMIRRDMGIDLVAQRGDAFMAVQCKYKKPNPGKRTILSWTALATFFALCMRTGPWDKYIVMTNCDSARKQGEKTEKDIAICLKSFQGITKEEWLQMCARTEGPSLTPEQKRNPTAEELRQLRLAFYK